ncbi:hypothetical protein L3X38_045426 [Prunus dulcis]|uniref:Uncharacterized protein n=1 Tax=Prunus dulcis TaxID=3755 RepID=A0AAD4V0I3_PRUDU|nr:hypothetical protein L3X38_045426 [Prunus dulcis]
MFGFRQNTGETLPNFRQGSKGSCNRIRIRKGKKVICARHLPGVGHAQDLARIPKRKLGRVVSIWYQSKLTGPDPISALEFGPSPVRVRHLANVEHNDLFTLPANKYGLGVTGCIRAANWQDSGDRSQPDPQFLAGFRRP